MSRAFRIKDFPEYYITDTGSVYTRNAYHNKETRIKKLRPALNYKNGYLCVSLCNKSKHYLRLIHRLVAEAFIPNPNNLPEVNHINGNKLDNAVNNLEWVTRNENIQHSYIILNRKPSLGMLGKLGKDDPKSKIVQQIKNGKVVAEFYGTREAERKTGYYHGNISKCCNGKCKTLGGFEWKYK